MKKFLVLFLVFVLLVPVFALADDSDYVGCWAHYDLQTDGTPVMSMLYLAENNTCYYIIQSFHTDEAGLGRTYVGTWKLNADGTIYAKTGNNTSTTLKVTGSSDSLAVNPETMDVFVNITPFKLY